MCNESIIKIATTAALSEIQNYGLPTPTHFWLSYTAGRKLAESIGADVNLVTLGVVLMDLKLGSAFSQGKLNEHTQMSVEATKTLLADHLNSPDLEKVLQCVSNHHGSTKYGCIEAEISANADCYRFIHPLGCLTYLSTLGKRGLPPNELFKQSRVKLQEKWKVVSLDFARKDLEKHYKSMSLMLDDAEMWLLDVNFLSKV